jgi:hypothetical protein
MKRTDRARLDGPLLRLPRLVLRAAGERRQRHAFRKVS